MLLSGEELKITELADLYYNRIYEQSITSNDSISIQTWNSFEDSIYAQLSGIKFTEIKKRPNKITYWLLKEELESAVGLRICKRNLWNVNHLDGWQEMWLSIAQFQPVGTDILRDQAFNRWHKFRTFVKNEIINLKQGISEGYSMPKEIVELVIDQIQVLLDYSVDNSPFMSPAKRDGSQVFYANWKKLVVSQIIPSIEEYLEYLKNDYLLKARTDVSLAAMPNGVKCYQAYIRSRTSTLKTGEEIYTLGKQIVAENKKEILRLGKELYGTNDYSEIIKSINQDSSNYFATSKEILERNSRLILKAKEKSKEWFSVLPSSTVVIKPYAPHESGGGGYEQAANGNPAYFRINLNNPEKQKIGNNERRTFHETYPGHHLQVGIEQEIIGLHPITKLVFFTSFSEGWARYGEQLAEEMDLYESKAALISRRAWLSRGMVIDPGLHLFGWTKEEVMNYVIDSGKNEDSALNLYHRIIVWPAQLTSYDVGGEEIKQLRKLAEIQLDQSFDIKKFHSVLLENGSIPLSALKQTVEAWINSNKNSYGSY